MHLATAQVNYFLASSLLFGNLSYCEKNIASTDIKQRQHTRTIIRHNIYAIVKKLERWSYNRNIHLFFFFINKLFTCMRNTVKQRNFKYVFMTFSTCN